MRCPFTDGSVARRLCAASCSRDACRQTESRPTVAELPDYACPVCWPNAKRYCAPARCYCGHPECPAFASYDAARHEPTREKRP